MDTHDQPNIDAACGQSSDSADKLRTCSDCQNDLICHDQGECLRRKVSAINDGGPAFPVPEENRLSDGTYCNEGMTLRDWFAGQALAGLLGNSNYGPPNSKEDANMAYLIADAMLKAREVKP
jgi:hypothetical protein